VRTLELVHGYLKSEARKANTAHDTIVIFRSPNGETDWVPLKPEEHPEWIKNPDVLGYLLGSNASLDHPSEPGMFYTAFLASDLREISQESAPGAGSAIARRAPRLVGPDGKPLN
jgi:hypothetical protein